MATDNLKDMKSRLQKELVTSLASVRKAIVADVEAVFKKAEANTLRVITAQIEQQGSAATSRATKATPAAKAGNPTKKSAAAKPAAKASAKGAKASGEFLTNADGSLVTNKDGTPRKRPGPPKGFRAGVAKAEVKAAPKGTKPAAVKKPGAPTKKVSPAKTAKAASAKPTVAEKISATKQAQKAGKPTLKDSLIIVFQEAGGSLGIKEATQALDAKGWLPNSEKPEQYIGSVLSMESKPGGLFEKVDGARGKYKLSKKAAQAAAKSAAKTPEKHENSKANGTASKYDAAILESGVLDAPIPSP